MTAINGNQALIRLSSAAKVLLASAFLSVFLIIFTITTFFTDGPAPERRLYSKSVIFPQAGSDSVFNQPWPLPEPNVIKNFEDEKLIFSNFSYSKGMGNQMFQLASLSAIASRHEAKVVIPESFLLRRSFLLDSGYLLFAEDAYIEKKLKELKEDAVNIKSCCSHQEVRDFAQKKEMVVLGYLQSHAYFHPEREKSVKRMFSFHEPVQKMASEFLQSAFVERSLRKGEARMRDGTIKGADEDIELAGDPLDSNVFVVGVHVRRGMDIRMNERNLHHGHLAAPLEYFQKAMKEAVEGQDDFLYVICSDDIAWAKRTFSEKEYGPVSFCPSRWREVDMAILLRADALVLSTGTFSWWIGYLSTNADKIFYYNGWPKPGSSLDRMVNKEKYFLPSWIPLT